MRGALAAAAGEDEAVLEDLLFPPATVLLGLTFVFASSPSPSFSPEEDEEEDNERPGILALTSSINGLPVMNAFPLTSNLSILGAHFLNCLIVSSVVHNV